MSEKQFKLSKYVTPSSVSYFCDENGRMLNKEVVKVLNEQQAIIRRDEMSIKTMMSNMKKLEKENEQLRKTINEVIELLLEEVDLFSDKATEHDIIAYNEMNQFDNKDAYYMCISTKKAIQMLKRCLDD